MKEDINFNCPFAFDEAMEQLIYKCRKDKLKTQFDKPLEQRPSNLWCDCQHE